MATDKRERQRANREQKKAAEEKAAVRKKRFDIVKRYAMYTAIFAVAILLLWLIKVSRFVHTNTQTTTVICKFCK